MSGIKTYSLPRIVLDLSKEHQFSIAMQMIILTIREKIAAKQVAKAHARYEQVRQDAFDLQYKIVLEMDTEENPQ